MAVTKPVKASRLYDALVEVFSPAVAAPADVLGSVAPGVLLGQRHPLRILIAEDNVVNQKVARAMLRQLGYRSDLVTNGLEAVDAVRRVSYDVVFMDLQMPELDGLGATSQIVREHPAGHRPRIVALTANAFDEDRNQCLAAGMTCANRCRRTSGRKRCRAPLDAKRPRSTSATAGDGRGRWPAHCGSRPVSGPYPLNQ
jgi:CheY-like chemotaxis protein